jgi:hypothetical protein
MNNSALFITIEARDYLYPDKPVRTCVLEMADGVTETAFALSFSRTAGGIAVSPGGEPVVHSGWAVGRLTEYPRGDEYNLYRGPFNLKRFHLYEIFVHHHDANQELDVTIRVWASREAAERHVRRLTT